MPYGNEYARYSERSYGLESSRPFGITGSASKRDRLLLAPGHPALRDCGLHARLYRLPARSGLPAQFEVYRMSGQRRCIRAPRAHEAIRAARESTAAERAESPIAAVVADMRRRRIGARVQGEIQQAAE